MKDFLHGPQIGGKRVVERARIRNSVHVPLSARRENNLADGVVKVVRVVARNSVTFGFAPPKDDPVFSFVGVSIADLMTAQHIRRGSKLGWLCLGSAMQSSLRFPRTTSYGDAVLAEARPMIVGPAATLVSVGTFLDLLPEVSVANVVGCTATKCIAIIHEDAPTIPIGWMSAMDVICSAAIRAISTTSPQSPDSACSPANPPFGVLHENVST
jgi:hypothetical protein